MTNFAKNATFLFSYNVPGYNDRIFHFFLIKIYALTFVPGPGRKLFGTWTGDRPVGFTMIKVISKHSCLPSSFFALKFNLQSSED